MVLMTPFNLSLNVVNSHDMMITFDCPCVNHHPHQVSSLCSPQAHSMFKPTVVGNSSTLPCSSSNTAIRFSSSNRLPYPFLSKCKWCRAQGHVVSQCSLFRHQFLHASPPHHPTNSPPLHAPLPKQVQAHVAATTTSPSHDPWILNNGATH